MIRRLLPAPLLAPLPALLLVLPFLGAALAGCATAPSAEVARTVVTADPADARCRLAGGELRPVPLEVAAGALPLTVTCERYGLHTAEEALYPLPGASLASALADGAVLSPMAADAPPPGAGASSRVPATLLVRLRPLLFTSPGALERYYGRLRAEREARWAGFVERVERECAAGPGSPAPVSPAPVSPAPAACDKARASVARQRDDDLRRLELDRRRATFR